ncbi:hypothetical protein [uncultured Schumannella sp.]|uniref:hypothetical protein n=1 Tax=uncultured Schumannella sp. TaxID=1195956 RepID=UPI0025F7AAA6|nr:hypothetical protein [uncultured Schumannella sp.]
MVVAPETGARIRSIIAVGHEWTLVDESDPADDSFLREGMGGWDEVTPSLAASITSDGTALPDHGEVWNRPWDVTASTPTSLTTRVRLTSSRLTLARHTEIDASGSLILKYTLTSAESSPTPWYWAAHPQFASPPGTVLELDGVADLRTQEGETRRWTNGDLLATLDAGSCLKLYSTATASEDGATLRRSDGSWMRLSWLTPWPASLGLWWDNSRYTREPTVAIEPTTSILSDSVLHHELVIAPDDTVGWMVRLEFGLQRAEERRQPLPKATPLHDAEDDRFNS